MQIRPLIALIVSIGLSAAPALAQGTHTPSFSATTVQTTPDQPDRAGKITKSGPYMRLEFDQNGQQVIQILRPTEGVTLVLFPENHTYVQQTGPVQPEEFADSYAPPCPTQAEESGLQCTRIGIDVMNGIPVERWHIGAASENSQMLILWDPKRKRALRQEMSDGTMVQMTFLEMQEIEGREAEHWVTEFSRQGDATLRNEWWFDPELKLVLRETLPGGIRRYLTNIVVGPVDPGQFEVPDGWQRVETPNPTLQE